MSQQKLRQHVLLLGDSITANQVATTRLADLLSDRWDIVNNGSACTTAQLLARVNSDVGDYLNTEYAIIQCGINDVIADIAAIDIEANLQAEYYAVFSYGIRVIAQTILPWGASAFWNAGRQAVTDAVNLWIMYSAIYVETRMNIYSFFETPADTLNSAYDNGDGLHLNVLGSAKLQSQDYSMIDMDRFMR